MARTAGNFGQKLAALIERDWGGNQAALANDFQISRQKVHYYLKGSIPPPGILVGIAKKAGTTVEWLLDEGDPRVIPPMRGSLGLTDKSPNQLLAELESLYLFYGLNLKTLLDDVEPTADALDRASTWVLQPHDSTKIPEVIRQAISSVGALDSAAYLVKNLRSLYRDGQSFPPKLQVLITAGELEPDHLLARLSAVADHHPGLGAIADYLTFRELAEGYADVDATAVMESFWGLRAPAWLAMLTTTKGLEDWPDLKKLKKLLRSTGYLDKSGRSVPLPAFNPYPWERHEAVVALSNDLEEQIDNLEGG